MLRTFKSSVFRRVRKLRTMTISIVMSVRPNGITQLPLDEF